MADIELVINIAEEIYKVSQIIDVKYEDTIQIPLEVIANGKPLPKGHGRLGDLDALREEVSSWGMNDYEPSDFTDAIDQADTIIEASKEHKDGNNNQHN